MKLLSSHLVSILGYRRGRKRNTIRAGSHAKLSVRRGFGHLLWEIGHSTASPLRLDIGCHDAIHMVSVRGALHSSRYRGLGNRIGGRSGGSMRQIHRRGEHPS